MVSLMFGYGPDRGNLKEPDKVLRWEEDWNLGELIHRGFGVEALPDETIYQGCQILIEVGPIDALSSLRDIASGLPAPCHAHGLGGRRARPGNPLNEEHLNTEEINGGIFRGLKYIEHNSQARKSRSLRSVKFLHHREACGGKPFFHFESDLLPVQTVLSKFRFYRGNPNIDTRHIVESRLFHDQLRLQDWQLLDGPGPA